MAQSRLPLDSPNAVSFRLIASALVECSVEDFVSSLNVWIHRPQVVNKRLLGAVVKEERDLGVGDEEIDGGKLITRQLIPKQSTVPWGWETVRLGDGE